MSKTELDTMHFIERATTDEWFFGLVMSSGDIIAIHSINDFRFDRNGRCWADVTYLDAEEVSGLKYNVDESTRKRIIKPAYGRVHGTVCLDNFCSFIELAYT